MKITTTETFPAEATFGLKRGYSNELITIEEFKSKLGEAQKKVASQMNIKLSAKITPCTIVFSGQDEDSISLSFIQYPKFPYEMEKLKNAIIRLIEILMNSLKQNRVVVVFNDETVMMEEDADRLDPGINFNSSR